MCSVTYFVILAPFDQFVQQELVVSIFKDWQHIVRQVPRYGLQTEQNGRRFSKPLIQKVKDVTPSKRV
jgi:diphthamide synthase (EF-2-diphthine--ammonia ligase)